MEPKRRHGKKNVRLLTAHQYPIMMPMLYPCDKAAVEMVFESLDEVSLSLNALRQITTPARFGDAFPPPCASANTNRPPTHVCVQRTQRTLPRFTPR